MSPAWPALSSVRRLLSGSGRDAEQPPKEEVCGICMETGLSKAIHHTECCGQPMCQACAAVHHHQHLDDLVCPFCRHAEYRVSGWRQELPDGGMLDGLWDVQIQETSAAGSCKHAITLLVQGSSASFHSEEVAEEEEDEAPKRIRSFFEGGGLGEVSMGHTPSGKSFTARQEVVALPLWLQRSSATVLGQPDVEGRLRGRDRASYSAVITVADRRGDIMKIKHEAQMTRKLDRSTTGSSTDLEESGGSTTGSSEDRSTTLHRPTRRLLSL